MNESTLSYREKEAVAYMKAPRLEGQREEKFYQIMAKIKELANEIDPDLPLWYTAVYFEEIKELVLKADSILLGNTG